MLPKGNMVGVRKTFLTPSLRLSVQLVCKITIYVIIVKQPHSGPETQHFVLRQIHMVPPTHEFLHLVCLFPRIFASWPYQRATVLDVIPAKRCLQRLPHPILEQTLVPGGGGEGTRGKNIRVVKRDLLTSTAMFHLG